MNAYDFSVVDLNGNPTPLWKYQGKILLIVNSAPHCTFFHWYEDLEKIYQKHKDNGFAVLDFPCNQFHKEAPETSEEINEICQKEYHTTYPRFQKTEVNGLNQSPLFGFLKSKLPFKGFDKGNVMSKVLATIQVKEHPGWEESSDIKWNFTMFLVDRNGKPVKRFEPTAKKEDIEKAIYRIEQKQIFSDDNNIDY